jgi:hypothetical protein
MTSESALMIFVTQIALVHDSETTLMIFLTQITALHDSEFDPHDFSDRRG